jgi:SAM-dependent methyltransferase
VPETNDTVAFYSSWADEFDASYAHDANRLERLTVWRGFLDRHAPDARSAYDLGCGSGMLTLELVRRGISTVAVDGSAEMLRLAEQKVGDVAGADARFEQRMLPFDTTSAAPVDLAVSSSVVEYLDSVADALESFRLLLRDGGILIFSVSNRDAISRRLARAFNRLTGRPRYLGHLKHMLTFDELTALTASAGFSVLEVQYFGGADRLNRLLGLALPARFASNMLIVAARRS